MPFRLEPRPLPSKLFVYLSPLLAVALTLITGAILFTALGHDPAIALYTFFVRPIDSLYGFGEMCLKATPLLLIAIGLSIGFRGNVWNIGAEGQLTMGAIAGGGVALAFYGQEGFWILPLMVLAGALGGMAWGAIPAFLKTRFNANEILTSLMLSYVSILILSYLVHGPWRDPEGFRFPESRIFSEAAVMPVILEGTRVTVAALGALVVVVLGWLMMSRMFMGFQVKVTGLADAAARYAGYSRSRVVWLSFLVSGGLAGIAGLAEVAGPIGQLLPTISPGYGFAAIIVAFVGRLHPVGILAASLLMALLYLGGETVQMELGLPPAVTGVFQGLLLFFLLASDVLIRYRIRRRRPVVEGAGS